MLYGRRQRLEQIAQAEAQGQNFWTPEFDKRARGRIAALVQQLGTGAVAMVSKEAIELLLREEGLYVDKSILVSLMKAHDNVLPSLIEATLLAVRRISDSRASSLEQDIAEVLNEHRISYDLINGEMIAFQSKELHQEVVAPVLRLLPGRPDWGKVEAAYQAALREISEGNPADAITDAGTALQEALTLLGCQGNALGSLIKSAKSKGLLAPHDSQLTQGIERIANWVAADRSESGDSHKASTAITRDDAWLTVHVVGALVLRLAAGSPRKP